MAYMECLGLGKQILHPRNGRWDIWSWRDIFWGVFRINAQRESIYGQIMGPSGQRTEQPFYQAPLCGIWPKAQQPVAFVLG